jgi:two-component system CheB/CheR fusion protein
MLRGAGHQVETALDGPSALKAADRFTPDVVVLDIGLPVMDGYEVASQLRACGSRASKAGIIAVTGYGLPSDRERAAQAGFDAHRVKPIDFAVLAHAIARVGQVGPTIASFSRDSRK